jgi:iduronate 2-sulfatase
MKPHSIFITSIILQATVQSQAAPANTPFHPSSPTTHPGQVEHGKTTTKLPNILMIGIDDLRPELGCYGADHMVTPHLDNLAGESIRFERAYTQQAVCLPARISLFSGQFPQTTGVTTLQDKFWELHENPLTLMRHLRDNGYTAIGMGKILHDEQFREWDDWTEIMNLSPVIKSKYASPASETKLKQLEKEARAQKLRGKDYRQYVRLGPTEQDFGPDENYHDHAMTDIAIGKLKGLKDSDKPFFMNVGYRKPHLPFVAPKRYWDLYDRDELKPAANPDAPVGAPDIALMTWGELRAFKGVPDSGPVSEEMALELKHGYFACVSFVDDQIGRLLAALDAEGLADNTLVIVWSDHGWKLGEHGMWCKHTNYEIDTRIPLFIRLPDGRQAGTTANELAQLVDLYPTICDYLGLPVPEHVEGTSLAHLFDDPDSVRRVAAYSEFQRHGGVTGFTMKTGNIRYTEWIHLPTGEIRFRELYDHAVDPDENLNRADDPDYADRIASLSDLLHKGPAGRYSKAL